MVDNIVAKELRPIGIWKLKDKFGFHRVPIYDGLEALQFVIRDRIREQKRKQDTVYLTSGLEGVGKSMFNLWALQIYEEETNTSLDIKHVTRTLDEMFVRIYELKDKPSILALDEGSELDGTNSSTKLVKSTKKKFTVMRKKSQIVFICFVNPLRITTYFREDRVRGLFFIVKTGEAWFYSNNQNNPHLAMIIDSWAKDHDAKSLKFLKAYAPDMILRGIPDYHGHLRKDYESRKDENIDVELLAGIKVSNADMVDEGIVEKEYVDVREAAAMLGIGDATVKNYIKAGYFNSIKIRHRLHIKRGDIIKYRDHGLGVVNGINGNTTVIM